MLDLKNNRLVKKNVDLQDRHTMASPATANFFAIATSIDDLISICRFAKKQALPIKILAEGSNVLLPEIIQSLVVKLKFNGIDCVSQDKQTVQLKVSASENWHQFILFCQQKGYFGLENLSAIPGSVGAAPVQNIGAYGIEVADFISQVEFFDPTTEQLLSLPNSKCLFSYRDSVFKTGNLKHAIITAVTFKLNKQFYFNDQYAGLKKLHLEDSHSNKKKSLTLINYIESIRWSKLPKPQLVPNAGSFFKNPVITSAHFSKLKHKFPNIVSYPAQQGVKVPAAWLIDQLGFKNKKHQHGITCYQYQALVLINPNRVGLNSVLEFAGYIQQLVYQNYQIKLEIEPQIIK